MVSRPSLPAPFEHFVDLFNRGAYWESHEVLERPWRETGSGYYHGLILFASAFVHVERGNPRGIVAQLDKAERYLSGYRPVYLGLDVDALLAHAGHCRRIVAEHQRASPASWPALVPRVRLSPDPARIRGDEPELTDDDHEHKGSS